MFIGVCDCNDQSSLAECAGDTVGARSARPNLSRRGARASQRDRALVRASACGAGAAGAAAVPFDGAPCNQPASQPGRGWFNDLANLCRPATAAATAVQQLQPSACPDWRAEVQHRTSLRYLPPGAERLCCLTRPYASPIVPNAGGASPEHGEGSRNRYHLEMIFFTICSALQCLECDLSPVWGDCLSSTCISPDATCVLTSL